MRKKKKKNLSSLRRDKTFAEVQHLLDSKKQQETSETVVREAYVDSYRGIAFSEGLDLKGLMKDSGKHQPGQETVPGEPNDEMYLRQAEHLMRRGTYQTALIYLHESLSMNPESKNTMATLARCYLLMGNWEYARMAAEFVLSVDKHFVKAIYAKAEALYNTCQFEHALVLFHRGKKLSPDLEEFRLGVQKCRKTIQNAISTTAVFKVSGARIIFHLLRRATDLRTARSHVIAIAAAQSSALKKGSSSAKENPFGAGKVPGASSMSFTGLTGIVKKKNKDESEKRVNAMKRWSTPAIKKNTNTEAVDDGLTERERRIIRVKKRCKEKAKLALSSDRLLEDKTYLIGLSKGIGPRPGIDVDEVELDIAETAYEALHFLNGREEFWKQIQLGESGGKHVEAAKKKKKLQKKKESIIKKE